jgi:transposase
VGPFSTDQAGFISRSMSGLPPKATLNSPYLYRARNLVQRFFNKIKHCSRVATRYDKLAANYLAFVRSGHSARRAYRTGFMSTRP